jgi:signal transduction histidine kinase
MAASLASAGGPARSAGEVAGGTPAAARSGNPNANLSVVIGEERAGFVIGGPTSGTLAFVVGPGVEGGGTSVSPVIRELRLPDQAGVQAALAAGESVIEADLEGIPVRILSTPITSPAGTLVVQVIGDRTAEVRTLMVLLVVLLVGGLLVLVASLLVGWLYADRALIPIREAMRHQREFAADASHELRTPLAVIRGNVESLRRRPGRPAAEVEETMTETEAEIDRLGALVDDLLLLARTDSGVLELAVEPADLAEMALDAGARLPPLAFRRALRVDAEPSRWGRSAACASWWHPRRQRVRHARGVQRDRRGLRRHGRLRVEDVGGFRRRTCRGCSTFWRASGAPRHRWGSPSRLDRGAPRGRIAAGIGRRWRCLEPPAPPLTALPWPSRADRRSIPADSSSLHVPRLQPGEQPTRNPGGDMLLSRTRIAALLAAILILLAACGGAAPSGVATLQTDAPGAAPSGSPTPSMDPETAQLEFAKCMRAAWRCLTGPVNGPLVSGDGATPWRYATEACNHLRGRLRQAEEIDPASTLLTSPSACMGGIDYRTEHERGGVSIRFAWRHRPGPTSSRRSEPASRSSAVTA